MDVKIIALRGRVDRIAFKKPCQQGAVVVRVWAGAMQAAGRAVQVRRESMQRAGKLEKDRLQSCVLALQTYVGARIFPLDTRPFH